MSTNSETLFEAFLNQHDGQAWERILKTLMPSVHDVDKNATEIWFHFFPLSLARALASAEDPEQLARKLQLQGKYRMAENIDTSHAFLYGHRYWPQVKAAVSGLASSGVPSSLELASQIRDVARRVAKQANAPESLLVGISAVAFMTFQQAGATAFRSAPGKTVNVANVSPKEVLRERAKDDDQGVLGFLKGARKEWTVTFDENDGAANFKLIHTQALTTAAANDQRDYTTRDPRCIPGGGPIPIECRSAACGTCWVGVLGGAEKLSDVSRLEGTRIKTFGYIETDDPKPLIRLACMAQAHGAASIVIPPWNGVFGKFIRGEKSMLEEAETGARG
ncbi:MAG TPA: 2Fe-2S iron-sulfur cluster-binding protein [Blastocatellia bacterium]|nr:2Fe-2S iron-sulfur cluster-binding protein [Blastocatellia bacterium]